MTRDIDSDELAEQLSDLNEKLEEVVDTITEKSEVTSYTCERCGLSHNHPIKKDGHNLLAAGATRGELRRELEPPYGCHCSRALAAAKGITDESLEEALNGAPVPQSFLEERGLV